MFTLLGRVALNPGRDYDATKAINAFAVKPDGRYARVMSRTVFGFKQAHLWNKLDFFHLMAAHNRLAVTVNIRQPGTFDLTAVNTPLFTPFRGAASDAVSACYSSAFVPSTAGGRYAQDSAHLAVYINSAPNAGVDTRAAAGIIDTNGAVQLVANVTTGVFGSRINQNSTDNASVNLTTGHFGRSRTGAAVAPAYKDGLQTDAFTTASTALSGRPLYVLARNNAGVIEKFFNGQVAVLHGGGGLTAPEMAAANFILRRRYLEPLGAQ